MATKKQYVGLTKNHPEDRWIQHCKARHARTRLREAIDKYGERRFHLKILHRELTEEQACEKEKHYIEWFRTKFPSGYNMTSGGEGISKYGR